MDRFDDSELKIVEEVIRSGELSSFYKDFKGGKFVQIFEQNFADYIGTKYAMSVSNGTVALEVALAALGVKRGDEVITTPLSFMATGTAIIRAGARPVFVDVEKDTLNIDPKELEDAITVNTKAILPVSLNGYPCNYDEIMDVASKVNDLFVLEDAAQSLGATYNGERIGAIANMSTFSFQETKTITTLGEGGMIVTDDPRFYERALNIRNHGNIYGTMNDVCCTNARMTEAQAAFGVMQLRKLDDFISIQRENAEYFLLHLPKPFKPVYHYPLPININPSYYLMPVVGYGVIRDIFLQYLKEKGVNKGLPGQNVGYYRKLLYESTVFRRRKCRVVSDANALWARDNVFLFDVHRWNKNVDDMKGILKLLVA